MARYAQKTLCALPGVTRRNTAFFGNEFAIRLPEGAGGAAGIYAALARQGIIAGALPGRWYPGEENILLLACTEKNNEAQIDQLAEALRRVLP